MSKTPRITHLILLQHMQAMKQELLANMKEMRLELLSVKTELKTDIQKLEHRMEWMKAGVGNIDKRVDDIEIEELPKRVRRIEKHLHLSAR